MPYYRYTCIFGSYVFWAAFIRPFPSFPGSKEAWGTNACPMTASSCWSLKDQQVKHATLQSPRGADLCR